MTTKDPDQSVRVFLLAPKLTEMVNYVTIKGGAMKH